MTNEKPEQGEHHPVAKPLYQNQNALGDEYLVQYASLLGLDPSRFSSELARHVHAARVHEDFISGARSGVNGTPSFFINGLRYDGSYDLETMWAALEKAS